MALLEVRGLTKLYQTEENAVPALRDVSLSVEAGEFVAIVGRSGCGKSTLLNLCGAMDFPSSGEVSIDGQVTTELDDAGLTKLRREKVGFIFQSFQLIHTLTAVENVELPLLLAKQRNTRATALERLAWVDMADLANRYTHQLSGGQQQRIAVARALVGNPKLLLADEPTGNLDSATGDVVLELLVRIAREFKVTVLMATHSAESAELADVLVRMRDGRIFEVNSLRTAGRML
ncbi:MAG: ABC transporter ATP-binding protein [Acidobacteriaceae bacterium]|nr:ABC transporter ATP-binding protein [Acidobacteriaceae bacterium]MBV9443174.1 ABC transporter ATP-binding protein [Acidobacteriaceae bacterium]